MEKMEVHQKALLHRAFSIFIFNEKGEMLLQKRAAKKYHSGGFGQIPVAATPNPVRRNLSSCKKRLQEEMGFSTALNKAFYFIYKAPFDNGLTEHEFDHVFTGKYDGSYTAQSR